MVNASFDALLQGLGLVHASHDNNNLSRIHDGLDADCKCSARHLGQIIVEEAGVGKDGVVCQGLDSGARTKTRSRFIEGNMTVWTDPTQEEVYAACFGDLCLKVLAFFGKIRRIAVQNVDVSGWYVDMGKEIVVHEAVVALRMVPGQSNIFILIPFSLDLLYLETSKHTMLNVTTFLKDIWPALYRWTRILYTISGLLPVGNPSTNGLAVDGENALMRPVNALVRSMSRRVGRVGRG